MQEVIFGGKQISDCWLLLIVRPIENLLNVQKDRLSINIRNLLHCLKKLHNKAYYTTIRYSHFKGILMTVIIYINKYLNFGLILILITAFSI